MTSEANSIKAKIGKMFEREVVKLAHPEGRRKSGQAVHRSSTYVCRWR
jgi:hypothetical protein